MSLKKFEITACRMVKVSQCKSASETLNKNKANTTTTKIQDQHMNLTVTAQSS